MAESSLPPAASDGYDGLMPMAPANVFAGSRLDRAGDRRNDAAWLAERGRDPEAEALVLWQGQALVAPDGAGLARLPLAHARAFFGEREVFLGMDGSRPLFAIELESSADPAEGALAGQGRFHDMRAAAARLPAPEAAAAGAARSLFDWRRRHRFCAACGQQTEDAAGGWKRLCPACGTEHFPRVDPVVIMLPVHRGGVEPRCLLGRHASWPEGRMSALAGFVEPGESIEEACAREVAEEAGLIVTAVRYHSSQPWPFPSQLMIGLLAEVRDDQARPDQTELEAVAWLTRAEAGDLVAGRHPSIKPPPRIAIARTLLQAWADGFEAE